MKDLPKIIAFLGKGGAGKTIISALCGKIISERGKKVLFIDADPTMGLTCALAVQPKKTMGMAREEIIQQARIADAHEERQRLGEIIDFLMLESLYEGAGFGLLTMGQTSTLGCYCLLNQLLRHTISRIRAAYDVMVIDGEAGIEVINRQVTESVDTPILVSDTSLRSIRTTLMAYDTLKRSGMQTDRVGTILNRTDHVDPQHREMLEGKGIQILGTMPYDALIAQRDASGLNPMDMPADAPSLQALRTILIGLGFAPPRTTRPTLRT